jgi:hypothetical protein
MGANRMLIEQQHPVVAQLHGSSQTGKTGAYNNSIINAIHVRLSSDSLSSHPLNPAARPPIVNQKRR